MLILCEYFELRNTISEYHNTVSGRYTTLDDAKKDMENHCDWYSPNNTGKIFKITIFTNDNVNVEVKEELVYKR